MKQIVQHIKMKNKILITMAVIMIGVFMISFASAGLFDFLKKDDLKQISIKDSIDDTWIKTLTKINKWTEDKLEIGLINKIKIELKDKILIDDKETDLTGSTIKIKENANGVKVVYNAG